MPDIAPSLFIRLSKMPSRMTGNRLAAILLGIFDKRMNKEGAISGILVGLIFTVVMIALMRSHAVFGLEEPVMHYRDFIGINAQGIGIVGMVLNFIVSYVVSRLTSEPPEHIQELVEDIRVPRVED
jgi:cation/acetate symporter